MEVRPGYKQTEFGVIPEEWALKPLNKLFAFSGGYTASRAQLSRAGHCYLHYGDIHAAAKTTIDTQTDQQNIPRLSVPLGDVSPKSLLKDGDVVFVDASEDDEGTSKHVVVVNTSDVPFISGLHTIVAKGLTDELGKQYRRYCFQTRAIRQQFLYYAVGTKVKGISKTNIARLWLPVPPLPEQRAIATALSDVDSLLDGLDRLIAKKRDLKQAAMQQLLTGQTRLPGFHGNWAVKSLAEMGTWRGGMTPSMQNPAYWDGGDFPWISSGDVKVSRLADTSQHVTSAAVRHGAAVVVPTDSIVLVTRSGILRKYLPVALVQKPMAINQDIKALIPNDTVSAEFLLHAINGYSGAILASCLKAGTTVESVEFPWLKAFVIPLPPLPEQTAIAAVLSDMDAELSALETRRDKTRDLKQAMMQELLTGNTRLVSAGGGDA